MSFQQLTLNFSWRDDAAFDNFYVGDNQVLINILHTLDSSTTNFVYFWGGIGSGRTHILLASCNQFGTRELNSAYIPLSDFKTLAPEIFLDLYDIPLLCIDDLDVIVGLPEWEEALFHCFNERMNRKVKTLVAANATPQALNFMLPDLQSRMSGGLLFELTALNDGQKLAALQLRAKSLGLDLPMNTAKFLLTHYARDTLALFALLKKLDHASLAEQRCLTIPFVKKAMNSE